MDKSIRLSAAVVLILVAAYPACHELVRHNLQHA
jgi:hypothetical protein